MTLQTALSVIWSGLSIFAVVYIVSGLGFNSFFLRRLSLNELAEGKKSKFRIWSQGIVTFIAMSLLIYAATYAIIAAIPYDWGSHDEDGEWSSFRDSARIWITLLGAAYFVFALDEVAKALLQVKIEKLTKFELTRGYSRSHEDAIKFVRNKLRLDDLANPYWAIDHQEKFARSVIADLNRTRQH